MPERLTPLSPEDVEALRGASAIECGLAVARHLLGDELEDEVLESAVREALGFPLPLVPLGPRAHVLELFHGPTLAFKDVGARFMGCLMSRLQRSGPPLTVMVATSGDTGGAVAHAFLGLPRTRVVVLFPEGQVSERQQRQFTTLGDQVLAVAVAGAFDDCQRLVKAMFRDRQAAEALALTSANSINIGRLLPQIFYYFHAWAQLNRREPPLFSVPSGNFGNLAAGLMAASWGCPLRALSPRPTPTTSSRSTCGRVSTSRGRRCARSQARWMSVRLRTWRASSLCSMASWGVCGDACRARHGATAIRGRR